MTERPKVLVVDDDDGILKLFESALKHTCDVVSAPDGALAKAIVDAQGRFWYMGSHNGRLGVIE